MNNDQTETVESKSGIDFCSANFEVSGQPLVNNYKCSVKKFSSPDLRNRQKKRRDFDRRTSIFAIN